MAVEYVDLGEGRFKRVTTVTTEETVLASEIEASVAMQISSIERQIFELKKQLEDLRGKQSEVIALRNIKQ
jgi:hypothetical protein